MAATLIDTSALDDKRNSGNQEVPLKLAKVMNSLDELFVSGTNDYKLVVYYPNWGMYGRKFEIFHMDWTKVTHINYAFADVKADGSVSLTDPWADVDKRYLDRGDTWNDPPNYLYGSLGQAYKLKKEHRRVKVCVCNDAFSFPSCSICSLVFPLEVGRCQNILALHFLRLREDATLFNNPFEY